MFEDFSMIFTNESAMAGFTLGFLAFFLGMLVFCGSAAFGELLIALVHRFIYPGKKKED